jgi:hypothetical protein
MLRRIPIIVGGIAVAVALPVAALALTPGGDATDDVESAGIAVEVETDQAQRVQNPAYEPQRLRVHADTGRPEGVEPVMRRLHQSVATQQGAGSTNPELGMSRGGCSANDAAAMPGAGRGQAGGLWRDQIGSNPPARPGDCIQDGDCLHEDGPLGSGPRGPGGNSG